MKKNRRAALPVTLRDILNYYPISETVAFNIARVHRTTWLRWMQGKTNPPAATVELIRMHALGEPADPAFAGFRFVRGMLYDDCGRGYSPGDIRSLEHFKTKAYEYFSVLECCNITMKTDQKKADTSPQQRLRLVK